MRAISALTALSLMGCVIAPAPPQDGSAFGFFPEPAQTQWLDDGRRMVLLRDFAFVEPDGTRWSASAAHVPIRDDDLTIDGASIPSVFWSVVGGPYEGLYRNASIVHDAECTPPFKHRWQDVHRMFYRAARAGGTSEDVAKLIFAAVWHFGPRWDFAGEPKAMQSLQRMTDAERLIAYILVNPGISTAEIEELSSETLSAGVAEADLERFRQELRPCNDPLGPRLAGRTSQFNEKYGGRKSGAPLACFGPR